MGAQFVKGFGGIGGLLRYQTELPSTAPDVAKDSQNTEDEYDFEW